MEIELKDLEVGDIVWCGGYSGFCHSDYVPVVAIETAIDIITKRPYKVIVVDDNHKFDSRTGHVIYGATGYHLTPADQKHRYKNTEIKDIDVFRIFMEWMNMELMAERELKNENTILSYRHNGIDSNIFKIDTYYDLFAGIVFDKEGNLISGYLRSNH